MSDTFDQAKADEIIRQIAQAVIDDPKYAGRDWSGIAVVSIIEPGVRQLSGYSFTPDGKSQPGTPASDEIDDLFLDLQKITTVQGKAPWKSALFQIRRDGMRYGIDFEYDDALRWKMNPSRMDEIIEALRPK